VSGEGVVRAAESHRRQVQLPQVGDHSIPRMGLHLMEEGASYRKEGRQQGPQLREDLPVSTLSALRHSQPVIDSSCGLIEELHTWWRGHSGHSTGHHGRYHWWVTHGGNRGYLLITMGYHSSCHRRWHKYIGRRQGRTS
jgi:hypothetical protein